MSKRLALTLLLLLFTTSNGWAATYYVATTGNDTTGTGAIGAPWATLQKANTEITTGDTVIVRGGTYSPSSRPILSITKAGTTWQAYTGETPILDGNETGGTSQYTSLLSIAASNVSVDGFTVRESRGRGIHTTSGSNNITIKNTTVVETWWHGIFLENGTGILLDNCDVSYGSKDYVEREWSTAWWASNIATYKVTNSVIKNSKIHNSYFEGLDILKGSDGVIVENCEIYGNQRLQIYVSNSRNTTLRYNLIYGLGANKQGAAIWLGGEKAFTTWQSPTWNTGSRVYGNFVAACTSLLRVAGDDATVSERNALIYNNTFVEATGDGTTWQRAILYADTVPTVDSTHEFKNNVIIQTSNAPAYAKSGHVTASHNRWSRAEADIDADIRGSNSIFNSAAGLAKTSGWTSGGTLTRDDFKISAGNGGLDLGTTLAAPYNSDYWGTARPQGTAFDIGAHELFQGIQDPEDPLPDPPMDALGVTFWEDFENANAPYAGGGTNSWSLVSAAEFSATGNKVGTNGLHLPTSGDYARLQASSGVTFGSRTVGSMATWTRYHSGTLPGLQAWVQVVDSTSPTNGVRFFQVGDEARFSVLSGGTAYSVSTSAANMSTGTHWYFVVGRWSLSAGGSTIAVEVYNQAGTLIESQTATPAVTSIAADMTYIYAGMTANNPVQSLDGFLAISSDYDADWQSIMFLDHPPVELTCGNETLEDWESCATCKEDDADCVDDETGTPSVEIISPSTGVTYDVVNGLFIYTTQAANCRFGTGDDNEYAEMAPEDSLTRDGLSHSKTLSLEDGEYTYHVACLNAYGEGRASTTFTQDTPAAITACIDYGVSRFAVNPGQAVSFDYCNTVPEGAEGLSCEWSAINEADEEVWTLTDAGCNDAEIGFTPEDTGLHSVELTVSTTSPEGSDTVTETDLFRVWCSATERLICSAGDCCDDDGSGLSFETGIGYGGSTLRLIGNVNLDLSGSEGRDVTLTGTGYGTISGGRIINSDWEPSSPPTMGNDVTLAGRIWPLMNWSGTGGSIQENTLFLGSGTGYTLDLSGLDGVSEACYVLPERPHGTLTFTSLDPGPCLQACTNARECVNPTWQRSLMHLITK